MRALVLAALLLLAALVAVPSAAAEPCEGEEASHSAPVGLFVRGGQVYLFVGERTHNGYWWGTMHPLAC